MCKSECVFARCPVLDWHSILGEVSCFELIATRTGTGSTATLIGINSVPTISNDIYIFCIYLNRLKLIETYRYSALLIQFVIVNMFRFSGWFLFLCVTFNKTVRRKKITGSLDYGTVCLENVLKNSHTRLIETWEFVQLSLWLCDLRVPQVFLIWFRCRMGCGEKNLLNSKNK